MDAVPFKTCEVVMEKDSICLVILLEEDYIVGLGHYIAGNNLCFNYMSSMPYVFTTWKSEGVKCHGSWPENQRVMLMFFPHDSQARQFTDDMKESQYFKKAFAKSGGVFLMKVDLSIKENQNYDYPNMSFLVAGADEIDALPKATSSQLAPMQPQMPEQLLGSWKPKYMSVVQPPAQNNTDLLDQLSDGSTAHQFLAEMAHPAPCC